MARIAGIVEEHRVDELTKQLIALGWGDDYSLITRETTSDEQIIAAPVPYGADGGPVAGGVALAPNTGVATTQTNEGVLLSNVKDSLDELELDDEEQEFYARLISDGGTFIYVDVPDDDAYTVQRLFHDVDAQQMEVAG